MTVLIDASVLTDAALQDYDTMMVEASVRVPTFAALAVNIWTEVLRELDLRGHASLVSGSYEDIGNALIRRHWISE